MPGSSLVPVDKSKSIPYPFLLFLDAILSNLAPHLSGTVGPRISPAWARSGSAKQYR